MAMLVMEGIAALGSALPSPFHVNVVISRGFMKLIVQRKSEMLSFSFTLSHKVKCILVMDCVQ